MQRGDGNRLRRGRWKFNYYHGQPHQLFDLEEDPREMRDLAGDPAHRRVAGELQAEVLDGWDPEWVARRLAELRQDRAILAAWGRNVRPQDQCRWDLKLEMDFLDEKQMGRTG